MKRLLVIFTFFLIHLSCSGQNKSGEKSHKQYRTLFFYTYGLTTKNWADENKCETELKERYRFGEKIKAGCVVRPGQKKRLIRHNKRVERKMQKRYGNDWRQKYEDELTKCFSADS